MCDTKLKSDESLMMAEIEKVSCKSKQYPTIANTMRTANKFPMCNEASFFMIILYNFLFVQLKYSF